MRFLKGSPNQGLDLPLEGRQTIILGPETPDLKGFSKSSGTTSHTSSPAWDYLLVRFMYKMGNRLSYPSVSRAASEALGRCPTTAEIGFQGHYSSLSFWSDCIVFASLPPKNWLRGQRCA